jgi:hypothetical protein
VQEVLQFMQQETVHRGLDERGGMVVVAGLENKGAAAGREGDDERE